MLLQFQIPCLRYQVLVEAFVRLFINEAKAGLLIDVTCRRQNAVCPKRDLAEADLLRKLYAFIHQASANAKPTRFWFNEQQAQLRR